MTERSKTPISIRPRKSAERSAEQSSDLTAILSSKIIGQPDVIDAIVPYVEMFQAGLAPDHRPVGVFLLLGPTGTGKTRTVEALAEALHGSARAMIKVDCGEYQMEHEVARLVGAPPGYLGHRETQPLFTQSKLSAVATDGCGLSLILFDEIEKAAPTMARLLLGVLDRGILHLGDNTPVNFEKTMIFLTSNLGAREMMREMKAEFGFQRGGPAPTRDNMARKLKNVAMTAMKKKFSPEFINRIDQVVTYRSLEADSFAAIMDHEVDHLQRHVKTRLGNRAFSIEVPFETRRWLIGQGTSAEYGARELKRTVHRNLTQPVAAMVARNQVEAGDRVRAEVNQDRTGLRLRIPGVDEDAACAHPTVLIVEGNYDLLGFLQRMMAEAGWEVLTAESASTARMVAAKKKPHAVLVESELPDGSGLELIRHLRRTIPDLQAGMMTGGVPDADLTAISGEEDCVLFQKPFLGAEVIAEMAKCLASYTGGLAEH